MSAIVDHIRAEHRLDTVQGCICGAKHTGGKGWWSKHIATVTEQATRAQIAADIAEYADRDVPCWKQPGVRDVVADSFATTVRIAKGGAS